MTTRTLVLLALLLPAAASAASKPVVAVFDLEAKRLPLSVSVRQALSDYLAAQLAGSGAFSVVPRDRLKRELTRQKKASYKDCYSQSCQIEIGQELAAQKAVSSQVMKLANRCVVTATLLDLRRAATDRAATEEGGCGEEALMASLRAVARKLAQGEAESPAAATPAEAVPVEPSGAAPSGPPGDSAMTRGPARAAVTIEEFTDYQCGFCRRSHETLKEVLGKFPGKVRYQHRDYPLDSSCNPRVERAMHPFACRAAYHARCAAEQGKFGELDDALFALPSLDEDTLRGAARAAKLDAARLQRCLVSPQTRAAVHADISLAGSRGISGTPVAFVDGERVLGARDASWWEQKIRELLGR